MAERAFGVHQLFRHTRRAWLRRYTFHIVPTASQLYNHLIATAWVRFVRGGVVDAYVGRSEEPDMSISLNLDDEQSARLDSKSALANLASIPVNWLKRPLTIC